MGLCRYLRRRRRRAANLRVIRENTRLRQRVSDLSHQLKTTQEGLEVARKELSLAYDVIERDRLRVAAESKIQAIIIAGGGKQ